ncbi:MAG TPA: hypothetical protein VF840_14305 [Terriglobales bacterium]
MGPFSPLQVALLIVAALSIVGVVIVFVRSRMTYSGYSHLVKDVRRLALAMRGEIFRDGSDVVISGTYERLPAVVRFSNEENSPGLNIRIQAPATFLLSVVAARAQVSEGGRNLVRTADERFDSRFNTRTDQPTQANMFINKQVTGLLQQLACSKNTYLSVGNGAIELSELVIPDPNPGEHAIEHLKSMAELSQALHRMPGSDRVKLLTFERERHVAARVAMVVGAVVALVSVFAATRVSNSEPVSGVNQTLSAGILPLDATRIPNTKDWRAATADDFDPVAVSWLRGNRKQPAGRIAGNFSGKGTGRDVAYLLVDAEGARRVVLLADNENRYDTKFPYIGLAVRVPKESVNSIKWAGSKAPEGVDGDGLLLLRKKDDPSSAIVLFLSGRGIVSASPANYQDINLEP